MLELSFLREHREEAEQRLAKRNIDAKGVLDRARELDELRRNTQTELDGRQAELNALSRSVGELMKTGKKDEAAKQLATIDAIDALAKANGARAPA